MARRTGGSAGWGVGEGLLQARAVLGIEVVNRRGEALGTVEDLVFDVALGRISYAVLSFGGFMGTGNRLFAIPWQSFSVDNQRHRLVLAVPRQVLENAPGFDRESWPDMGDPGWQSRLQGYYRHASVQPRAGLEAEPPSTDVEARIALGLTASATVEEVADEPIQRELAEGRTVTDLEAGDDISPEELRQTESEERRRKAA